LINLNNFHTLSTQINYKGGNNMCKANLDEIEITGRPVGDEDEDIAKKGE